MKVGSLRAGWGVCAACSRTIVVAATRHRAAVLSLLLMPRSSCVGAAKGGSAAELLGRSAAAERARDDDRSSVTNRVFHLEQSGRGAGEPTLRRRVEIWQSAGRRRHGATGLRLPRATCHRRRVGGRNPTVFSPGAPPATSAEARPRPSGCLRTGALWRLTPSPMSSSTSRGRPRGARRRGAATYTISHRDASDGGVWSVTGHQEGDLRGVELRIVRSVKTVREYRFVESQLRGGRRRRAPFRF